MPHEYTEMQQIIRKRNEDAAPILMAIRQWVSGLTPEERHAISNECKWGTDKIFWQQMLTDEKRPPNALELSILRRHPEIAGRFP